MWDEGTIDWMFDTARWWFASFGGYEEFRDSTPLVLPTEDDFPVDRTLEGDDLAQQYFRFVKEHAYVDPWPLVLVSEEVPNVADILRGMSHHMTGPLVPDKSRDRVVRDGTLPIPYAPPELEDPIGLVATMARGVSHYMLFQAPAPFPGGADAHRLAVDFGGVFLGFGVFLANAAFRFRQTTVGIMQGWGYSRRGALNEPDLSYALALFATLLECDDKTILMHLRPNPRGFFKDARKHLRKRRRSDVDELRAISPATVGPYR